MKRFAALVALALAIGCAPASVKPRLDSLGENVAAIRSEAAIRCAPREWAAVQTSYRFARDARTSRRYDAAARHMDEAEAALVLVRRHVADCQSGASGSPSP